MSTAKRTNKTGWGGKRDGAGRSSGDKTKISVTVDEENWQIALSRWPGKPSWLVDTLLADYISGEEMAQEARAV